MSDDMPVKCYPLDVLDDPATTCALERWLCRAIDEAEAACAIADASGDLAADEYHGGRADAFRAVRRRISRELRRGPQPQS